MTRSQYAAVDLASFKKCFPIPEECFSGGTPYEYFWTYHLPVTAQEFWPFISDSSRMNREVGYEEVFYEEIDGVLHGSSGEGKLRQEWIEFPFEWNYPVFVRRLRKYSKGMPAYNFIQGYIEPTEDGCTVHIHNVVFSDHPLAPRLLPRYLEPFGERYGSTFQRAVEAIQNQEPLESVYPPQKAEWEPDGLSLLEEGLRRMKERGYSTAETDALRSFVKESDRELLHRIRPLQVAGISPDPRRRTGLFLHGVVAGLFTMNYEVICPHCRGSRMSKGSLTEIPARAECHVCEIEFHNGREDSLEITFRLHPSIARTRPSLFCAAEPSRKTHVRIQRMIPPGPETFEANLPPGRYRFLLQREQLPLAAEFQKKPTNIPGMNGQCVLENPFGRSALLMVEEPQSSKDALKPSILFSTQEFRDLFAGERLSADLQIDIGRQTIAFVDIVGSTRFYEERGDGPAFQEVKRHFEELFSLVSKHGGSVIKTIGDGAMSCFPSTLHGFRCGLEAVREFARREDLVLAIRISLHTGPCLAVNFNTGVDFFGRTVNLAAKLQNITGANQVSISGETFLEKELQDYLHDGATSWSEKQFEHPTLIRPQKVYLFQ